MTDGMKMRASQVSMLLLLCMANGANGQIMDIIPCDSQPANNSGPPLPSLPNQFVMNVEANIVQKNRTSDFREYYDYPNNRGVFEWYNRTSGERVKMLLDFNLKEARTIFENKTCRYSRTTSSHPVFTFMSDSNGTHIKSAKDLLEFGKDKGEVFQGGDQMVRGIPVNHWKACFQMPSVNGTFNLDYYFTKGSGYLVDGTEVQVPVRAVLMGSGRERYRNGTVSDDVHSYYHIYEFSDFKPGPIKHNYVFEVPVGVICNQGDVNVNKTAPQISDHFSAGLETVTTDNGHEMDHDTAQLYMDTAAKVHRVDTERPATPTDKQKFGSRPLIYIKDVENGLSFILDRFEGNCSVSKITQPFPGPGPKPGMKSPTEFIDFFQNFSNYLYQGQKVWRGMEVETWGYVNTQTGEIVEIIFHSPQAHSITPGGGPNMPVNLYEPVGVYKYNPAIGNMPALEIYEHMYGFSNGHPDPEIFDVSKCFSLDAHTTYLAVDVSGVNAREIVRFYQKEFVSEMRQTLATAAKISVTRIASLKWEEVRTSGTSTTFVITFQLLDNKLSGIDGTIYSGPSQSAAIQNLQQAINGAQDLTFDLTLATGTSVKFTVLSGSLWELYSDTKKSESKSTVSNYGPGSMAGLAIGMLIVGALLGLLAAYVIYRRFNTEVPYEVTH